MAGGPKPNEMKVKDPPVKSWDEAVGQGGPNKQSGHEGPDMKPKPHRAGSREDD